MMALHEAGERQHLRSRNNTLSAAAVNANLEHCSPRKNSRRTAISWAELRPF